MEKNRQRRSDCPISFVLDTLGDKWSLLIIRDLMFKGKKYYGEFSLSEERISTNILAERLERLEAEDFISKVRDSGNRSKFEYRLTKKGTDLLPMLLDIIDWGAKYDAGTATPKSFVRRLKRDREGMSKEILDKLTPN
jgi:DNA-binding HxlR family transcriptional regulator